MDRWGYANSGGKSRLLDQPVRGLRSWFAFGFSFAAIAAVSVQMFRLLKTMVRPNANDVIS